MGGGGRGGGIRCAFGTRVGVYSIACRDRMACSLNGLLAKHVWLWVNASQRQSTTPLTVTGPDWAAMACASSCVSGSIPRAVHSPLSTFFQQLRQPVPPTSPRKATKSMRGRCACPCPTHACSDAHQSLMRAQPDGVVWSGFDLPWFCSALVSSGGGHVQIPGDLLEPQGHRYLHLSPLKLIYLERHSGS